jgi:hypothetical protein
MMIIERRALRRTGALGLACVALWAAELPLRLAPAKASAFLRVLFDQTSFVALLLFAVGLRHLVLQARPERESAGTLVVAAAVAWLSVGLVADGLDGGAVTATFLGAAAHATRVSRVLPRWSAWLAVAGAVLAAACIPATYLDADARAVTLAADVVRSAWFLAVSLWMVRRGTLRVVGRATA